MGALPPPRAWQEHYTTLASVVDGVTWTAVTSAYAMAEYALNAREGTVPIRTPYGRAWLPDEVSQEIHEAQRSLVRYADFPREWEPMEPVAPPT
jgi:hypothetical protein